MDIEYLYLTEVSLPRLLWRVAGGRETCIIGVWSYTTVGDGGWLRRLADRLRAAGRVTELVADRPEWTTYVDSVAMVVGEDAFATNEAAIERAFDLAGSDRRFARYGLALRHAVCNLSVHRLLLMHRIRDICANEPDSTATLAGIDPEILVLYADRFGAPPSLPLVADPPLRPLVNLIGAAVVLLVGIGRTLAAIRPRPPAPESLLLGSDFINDRRDFFLWREVAEDSAQVMAVFRNADFQRSGGEIVAGWRNCGWDDGVFSPLQGGLAALEIFADVLRLLVAGWALPPDIFRTIIRLPYRRMVFRGLFNRYRFRFFWDRSDYDTDHIIRSQELRAAGGRSLGLMHGIPSIASVVHQLRHLDYDVYFALGLYSVKHHYAAKWPGWMKVVPVGSFGLTRDELHRLAELKPSRDMVFFVVPTVQGHAALEAAEAVARAFPDRRIFVNTKNKERKGVFRAAIDQVVARTPNVILHTARSYELMFECGYVFSESSTLTAEAASFGRYGFALCLIGERWKSCYYRPFPGVVLASAEEAIARIKAIEAGTWTYPRDQYADMIGMTGEVFYDTVRAAMGLPVKEGPLAHLAFCPTKNSVAAQ